MRFVSLVNAAIGKARRYISAPVSIHDKSDLADESPQELAKTLRLIMLRVNKLEASIAPEGTEFEVDVPAGGAQVNLFHNYKGPVRWYLVSWGNGASAPTTSPIILVSPLSTPTNLVLLSTVAGRAIIRVEPTQNYTETL